MRFSGIVSINVYTDEMPHEEAAVFDINVIANIKLQIKVLQISINNKSYSIFVKIRGIRKKFFLYNFFYFILLNTHLLKLLYMQINLIIIYFN